MPPENQSPTPTTEQGQTTETQVQQPSTEGQSGQELFQEGQQAEQQQQEQQTEGQQQETETQEPAAGAANGALTRDDIADILSRAIAAGQQSVAQVQPQGQQAAQQEPQLTQEQFDQMFRVFKPTTDLMQRLHSQDPNVQVAAYTELRDGLIRQAMTMAEYRLNQQLQALRQNDLGPLQTYVTEQQASSFRNDFFKKYPDLEKYELIVDSVSQRLHKQGFSAASRDAVMQRFATDARAAVKVLLAESGNGQGGNGGQPAAQQGAAKQQGRRMSTLTGGGQGGTSRPGGGAGGQYAGLSKGVADGMAALD